MNREKWKQFLLMALLAAVGSILVGVAFFGHNIFDKNRVGFQFLSFGIIGGFLFSSFKYLKLWIAGVVVVLLLVLNEALLHSGNWDFIWQDILYYVAVSVSLFIVARYYFPKLAGVVLARLLAVSSLMSVTYIIVTVIFYFVFLGNPSIPRFNLSQMVYYDLAQGFLLGLGLGAGIEAADYVLRKTARATEKSNG